MKTPNNFDIHSFESRLTAKNRFDGNLRFGAGAFHAKTNRTGVGKPSSGYLIREHAKLVQDSGTERYQRMEGFWESVGKCPVCDSVDRSLFVTRFGLDAYWDRFGWPAACTRAGGAVACR